MKHICLLKVAGHLALFGLLGIVAIVFKTAIFPSHIGFFCSDASIRYPYRESTVPAPLLHFISLFLPVVLILSAEAFYCFAWEKNVVTEIYAIGRFRIHHLIVRLYYFLGYFLVGWIINRVLCDIAKFTTGQLRPHFISVCQPNQNLTVCNSPGDFIEEYQCTGTDTRKINDVRLSFCSGHTAYSFYAAVYLFFYLESRFKQRLSATLVLPVVHFVVFSLAMYIGFTRVRDYKHHLSNVYFGAALGTIMGYIVAMYFAGLKKCWEVAPKENDTVSVKYSRKAVTPSGTLDTTDLKKQRKMKLTEGKENQEVISIEGGERWNTLVY